MAEVTLEDFKDLMSRRGAIVISEESLLQMLDLPDGYMVRAVSGHTGLMGLVITVVSQDLEPVENGMESPLLRKAWDRYVVWHDGKPYYRWSWGAEWEKPEDAIEANER